MSILTHYHIIPFDDKSKSGFKINNDSNNIQKFTKENANDIIERFKQNAKISAGRKEAEILEKALNEAIVKCEKEYEILLKNFVKQIDNKNFQTLLEEYENLFIIQNGTIVLNDEVLNNNFDEIKQKTEKMFKPKYDKLGNLKTRDVNLVKQELNGILSGSIRGEIFEKFLALIFSQSKKVMTNITTDNLNEIINSFEKAINVNLDTKKVKKDIRLSHTGKNSKSDIKIAVEEAELGFDTITLKNSYYKSDVSVKIPNGQFLNVSAKNLASKNSDKAKISILDNGNLTNLVEQWYCDNKLKNLAINGLSARTISKRQFSIMKKIFLIQAVIGSGKNDIMADYWIINTNIKEKPIRVLSMYDIFFSGRDFIKEVGGKTEKGIKPINKIPRTSDSFGNFVKSTSLSLKTQLSLNSILANYDNAKS